MTTQGEANIMENAALQRPQDGEGLCCLAARSGLVLREEHNTCPSAFCKSHFIVAQAHSRVLLPLPHAAHEDLAAVGCQVRLPTTTSMLQKAIAPDTHTPAVRAITALAILHWDCP